METSDTSAERMVSKVDQPPLDMFDTGEAVLGPVTARVSSCLLSLVVTLCLQVLSAEQHSVYLQFLHQDEEEVCVFSPGRMFVNGAENLLKFALAPNITKAIFPEGSEFSVLVQRLVQSYKAPFSFQAESSDKMDQLEEKEKKRRRSETKEVMLAVSWGASLVFRGETPPLEKINTFRDSQSFIDHQVGWERMLSRVCDKLLSENKLEVSDDNNDSVEDEAEKWFLVCLNGVHPRNIPEEYPQVSHRAAKGVVTEIHGNLAGVVDVGPEAGGQIRFHRSVVSRNGVRLMMTGDLGSVLSVGQEVTVDVDSGDKVASRVSVGCAGVGEEPHPEEASYGQLCHRVRVVELEEDEEGKINGGLGCIQYSQFIKNGMASASMVGEFVNFSRENLFFFGVRLRDSVDLAHLLTVGDEMMCHLKMLDTKQGRAQFVCRLGWVDGPRPGETVSPHLSPSSAALHKWCERKAVDWVQMEKMVTGQAGAKMDLRESDMAVGYITDLDPAENNETTARGLIRIEVGPHRGRVVRFNRSKATLFGLRLEKADLLYVVRPYDRVYCEVSGIADYPEGQYMSQRVQFHSLHTERDAQNLLEGLNVSERLELLSWLSCHHNEWSLFTSVLAGNSPTRYYIPFPRDAFPGRVVRFDQPKNSRYAIGCTSGTIVLDQGSLNLDLSEVSEGQIGVKDMKEVKVTFHRASFWIYGRKMAKADLSYVVQPNQKVMVECKKITEKDREQHSSLPADINYRATVIWVGPTRPRNDRDDPNRNDPGNVDRPRTCSHSFSRQESSPG